MTLRLLIAGSLLWFATLASRAQSADDFFNGGAQFYISNSIPDALKKVEAGRQMYPSDIKLKKLEELLKQQQQQNQQNQQNQKNQSKQNQNSKNQPSQSQKQQKNQSNPQNQQPNQAQQQQAQKNPQKQNAGQQPHQAAMTPQEAKRLLDSQKGNEQVLQFNNQNQPQNQLPPVKDW